eukprot:Rmarinus@m.5457
MAATRATGRVVTASGRYDSEGMPVFIEDGVRSSRRASVVGATLVNADGQPLYVQDDVIEISSRPSIYSSDVFLTSATRPRKSQVSPSPTTLNCGEGAAPRSSFGNSVTSARKYEILPDDQIPEIVRKCAKVWYRKAVLKEDAKLILSTGQVFRNERLTIGQLLRQHKRAFMDVTRRKVHFVKKGEVSKEEWVGQERNLFRVIRIFHPEAPFQRLWVMVDLLLILYCLVAYPYRFAFEPDGERTLDSHWFFPDLLTDLFFASDMLLKFNTAYFTSGGTLVVDRKRIASTYFHGWFLVDLVSTLPLDVMLPTRKLGLFRLARVSRLSRIFRLLRLVRLVRLAQTTSKIDDIEVAWVASLLKLCKILFFIFVLAHLTACMWFMSVSFAGMSDEVHRGWVESYAVFLGLDPDVDHGTSTYYAWSLYWAFTTITTVGFGDIVATNEEEMYMSIILMFLGAAAFAYIIGSMSTLIFSLSQQESLKRQKRTALNEYLKSLSLDLSLKQRVRDYMDYRWDTLNINEDAILAELSPVLRSEIMIHLSFGFLTKMPMFQGARTEFVRDVVNVMTPLILSPDDVLFTKGEVGTEMFVLRRGEVQVYDGDGHPVATLGPGNFFGEISLLCNAKRSASVQAITFCDLLVLHKADFSMVLENHPEMSQKLERLALTRMGMAVPSTMTDSMEQISPPLPQNNRETRIAKYLQEKQQRAENGSSSARKLTKKLSEKLDKVKSLVRIGTPAHLSQEVEIVDLDGSTNVSRKNSQPESKYTHSPSTLRKLNADIDAAFSALGRPAEETECTASDPASVIATSAGGAGIVAGSQSPKSCQNAVNNEYACVSDESDNDNQNDSEDDGPPRVEVVLKKQVSLTEDSPNSVEKSPPTVGSPKGSMLLQAHVDSDFREALKLGFRSADQGEASTMMRNMMEVLAECDLRWEKDREERERLSREVSRLRQENRKLKTVTTVLRSQVDSLRRNQR